MSSNYFQATKDNPYHLSIGAVVMNKEGKVACHFFKTFSHPKVGDFDNLYILMRETMEPNETIEKTLERGLMEEFGVEATLKRYLGPIVSSFNQKGLHMEKTTLYFLCDLISFDEANRSKDDPESGSEIKWLDPQELISKMKEQGERFGRKDADESAVLERI